MVAGCSGGSDAVVKYIGQNMDAFVMANGAPQSSYQLNNGGKVYRWSSGVRSIPLPSTTNVNVHDNGYGNYTGNAITTGGGSLNMRCELQITTDASDTITNITCTADTMGKWQFSRCAEVIK